jgi:mono/diheme cytochrome c family protein
MIRVLILGLAVAIAAGSLAWADDATTIFSKGENFDERSGQSLYTEICQDCHMADGKGAAAAGRYPSLAGNTKLEVAGYPLTMVLQGRNGMPPIGKMMTDEQVAMVVNYVRTHFGNAYTDAVKPEDVKPLR